MRSTSYGGNVSNIESTPRLRSRKRGLGLPVIIAGAVASLVLALSVSPSFAAFTASITNSSNTAGSGTVAMTESSGTAVPCTSTGDTTDCSTINKYGNNNQMVPGQSVTTAVSIKNTGTVPVSAFTLAPATCSTVNNPDTTVHGTGDLCSKLNLELKSGNTVIYSGTLAGFTASQNLYTKLGGTPIAVGATIDFSFKVTLDTSADNTFAGRQASQQMTWTFQAGA